MISNEQIEALRTEALGIDNLMVAICDIALKGEPGAYIEGIISADGRLDLWRRFTVEPTCEWSRELARTECDRVAMAAFAANLYPKGRD